MRYLLLCALVLFASIGFADQPPADDSELSLVFETRVIAIPAEAPLPGCPQKEGEVAFLNEAEVKSLLQAVQGNRKANILQAPKLTTFNGQEAVIRITQQETFVTGIDVKRINGVSTGVPRNTVVETGSIFTLKGAASTDKRFVEANVSYKNTRVDGPVELMPVIKQIAPVFEGGSQGKPVAVTQFLQSPKVETVTVEKVGLTIGSGGHAVIAGPSYIAEVREEMSVPVLSRVPYLSRMFRTVAYTKTNMRTVLIVSPKVIEAN